MSEPLSLSASASAVAPKLASGAITWGMEKFSGTRTWSQIQEKVGIGEMHPKAEKIFERAIARAGDEIAQLDGSTLTRFIEDENNRQIIASWVWDPDRAEITRDQLDWGSVVSQSDRSNVGHFLDRLPGAIRELRREVFDDEAWFITESVQDAIKQEGQETRAHTTEEHEETRSEIDEVRGEVSEVKDVLAKLELENTSELEEAVSEEVERIEELREGGQVSDALVLAEEFLENAEAKGLSDAVTRAIHSEIANCHLARVDHREKAIPHLERVAELADEEHKATLNRAIADLLRGEVGRGLDHIERVLEERPEDHDAVLLKSQLLAEKGNASESADLFEEVADLGAPTDLYNLGSLEMRAERFSAARDRARRALDINQSDAGAHFLYGLSVVVQRSKELEQGEWVLSEETGSLLKKAYQHLEQSIEEYSENQQPDRAAMARFNFGVLNSMLGNEDESLKQFRRANDLSPGNPETLHNLAQACLEVGEEEDGLRFLEELKNTDHDFSPEQMLYLEANLLIEAGTPDEAVTLLRDVLETDKMEDTVLARQLLGRALHRDLQSTEASKVLDQLVSDHPSDPRPYLQRGILKRKTGDLEGAIEDFRTARSHAEPSLKAQARRLLADALFHRGRQTDSESPQTTIDDQKIDREQDLKEAEELYAEVSSTAVDTLPLRRRALCLFRLGRYPECLQLCEEVQEEGRIPTFVELEGLIFQLHDNFSEAAERFEWLIQNHRDSVHFLLKYSKCLFRLGNVDGAKDAVDQAARRISRDSVEEQLTVSQTYAEYGELKPVVQHAYLALQTGEDDPRAHQYYISLFLLRGDDIREQDAASEEHRKRFYKALTEYEEQFPDEPFFEPVEVPTDDPDALIDEIKGVLPPFEDQKKRDRKIREDEIPVGSAAKMLGRRIPVTWKFLSSHPDYCVKADEGKEGLVGEEAEVAYSSAGVVVDLVPLLTLQELGLLEELSEEFSRILVPQAALDELREAISNERPREGEPRRSIKQTEEGLVSVEKPAEAGDRWLHQLERLYEFLTSDSVIPIGQTVHRDNTPRALADADDLEDEDLEYEDLLGNVSAEAILEGRARGLPVYSEDRIIRHLIRSEGRQAFGTQALLEVLLQKEQIEAETYHEARVRLLQMSYIFPLTSAQTIAYTIEREDFVPTAFSKAPIEALNFPGTNLESILRTVVGVLAWLWKTHPVGIEIKPALSAYWMGKILSVATRGPGRRVLAPTFAKIMNEYVLPELSPLAASQFVEAFDNWQRLQGHRLFPGQVASSLPFPAPVPLPHHTLDSEAESLVANPNAA